MKNDYASKLYINGMLRDAQFGRSYSNVSPVKEQKIGTAADATAEDMDSAIGAARTAFDTTEWSLDTELRIASLEKFRDALRERRAEFRHAAQAEVGAAAGVLPGSMCDHPLEAMDYWIDMVRTF